MEKYREGYVYHIKDEFFEKVKDDKLMKNKENGTYRPTFYCLKDETTELLWVVPMSSRVEQKYQALHDKQEERYGESLMIVLGEFDNKKAAFLIQNMFPITEKYLDHVHTKNGNPVPVKVKLQEEVRAKVQKVRGMTKRGKKIVFPDIKRIEAIMLEELQHEKELEPKEPLDNKIKKAKDFGR